MTSFRWLALLVLASTASVSILGFAAMNPEGVSSHAECLAAIVNGRECPRQADLLQFASFHAGALKSFSTAVFFSSLLFLALFAFAFHFEGIAVPQTSRMRQAREARAAPRQQKFLRWLSLRRRGDPIL